MRSTSPARGEKWHLEAVVVTMHGEKHWLWRALDEHGDLPEVLVQSRRDKAAARRPTAHPG